MNNRTKANTYTMFNRSFTKAILISALAIFTVQNTFAQQPAANQPVKPAVKPAANKPVTTAPKTTAPSSASTAKPTPVYTPVAQPAPTDRSINGQYQYLLTKLYGYQRPMASAFYKVITDSLRSVQKRIKPLETNVAALQDTAKNLHSQLTEQQKALDKSSSAVDNISLGGINMTKSAYNMLMWGLVVLFGVVAAVVITRSGSYSREAKHRIQLYDELEEEHKNYKAKAGEKEKKLARELQTARNKLEELTGNPNY